MTSKQQFIDDTAVLTIQEDFLDALSAQELRQEVVKLYEKGYKKFVLDMSEVKFIDSAGIGAILLTRKIVGAEGNVALCNVQKPIENVLTLVNLKHLIRINVGLKEALDHMNQ
jgi:anti-sigma B factor antagonist